MSKFHKKSSALVVLATLAVLPLAFAKRTTVTPSTMVPETVKPKALPTTRAQMILVKNGHARLLTFPAEIIAVFFSDPKIIDAQTVNRRTLAVTTKTSGKSTLVVYISRFAGDKVGRANSYQIEVRENSRQMVAVDAAKVSRVLGRTWPDGATNFEQMLVEEIEKRDRRIEELSK